MTIKDAKDIQYEWINNKFPMLHQIEVEELIDSIYKDIDSQICKNCQHWDKYHECLKLYIYDPFGDQEYMETDPSFGCNRFTQNQ